MGVINKDRLIQKMEKLFNKALKLYNEEKWKKASNLFKECGFIANKIGDKEIEEKCVKYMEHCMIKLQEIIDKEEKELEDRFSQLY